MKKTVKFIVWTLVLCLLLSGIGYLGWLWYDNNVDRSGWRQEDGITMYADFHGKPVTGWLEIEGSRYHFGSDFALDTGWLTEAGATYHLAPDGKMQTLWQDIEERRYYFGADGILRTGWQTIDANRYYLGTDGAMVTGWVELGGIRHYLDENGRLSTGWLTWADTRYYLNENGTPITGWLTWEENLYCFDPSGSLYTGWQEIGETRYCFTDSGAALTGWQDMEEGRFYFGTDGAMATYWQEIEDARYYFGESGVMHTGWLQEDEYRYYLQSDGTMANSPTEIDGTTYYFSPLGPQVLLVNPWHPLPADFTVELVALEDGHVSPMAFDALTAMLEACRAEGLYPAFSSTYRNEAEQRLVWQEYVERFLAAGYDEATANTLTASYVAIPGTSEHHTGLAVDIVGLDYFHSGYPGATKAVQDWLAEHCWEYGFILRYTKDKQSITGFAPETWHFRYVGRLVSMDMKDSGLCLEEYLGAVNGK